MCIACVEYRGQVYCVRGVCGSCVFSGLHKLLVCIACVLYVVHVYWVGCKGSLCVLCALCTLCMCIAGVVYAIYIWVPICDGIHDEISSVNGALKRNMQRDGLYLCFFDSLSLCIAYCCNHRSSYVVQQLAPTQKQLELILLFSEHLLSTDLIINLSLLQFVFAFSKFNRKFGLIQILYKWKAIMTRILMSIISIILDSTIQSTQLLQCAIVLCSHHTSRFVLIRLQSYTNLLEKFGLAR